MDALGLFSSGLFQGMSIVWSAVAESSHNDGAMTATNNSQIVVITSSGYFSDGSSGNTSYYSLMNNIAIIYKGCTSCVVLSRIAGGSSVDSTFSALRVELSADSTLYLTTLNATIAAFGVA